MKNTELVCDCGCKMITPHAEIGWLELTQLGKGGSEDAPKLKRELHFASFECLARWSDQAKRVIPELQTAAARSSPRGDLYNPSVPQLYV
jgi:hypothetical protein